MAATQTPAVPASKDSTSTTNIRNAISYVNSTEENLAKYILAIVAKAPGGQYVIDQTARMIQTKTGYTNKATDVVFIWNSALAFMCYTWTMPRSTQAASSQVPSLETLMLRCLAPYENILTTVTCGLGLAWCILEWCRFFLSDPRSLEPHERALELVMALVAASVAHLLPMTGDGLLKVLVAGTLLQPIWSISTRAALSLHGDSPQLPNSPESPVTNTNDEVTPADDAASEPTLCDPCSKDQRIEALEEELKELTASSELAQHQHSENQTAIFKISSQKWQMTQEIERKERYCRDLSAQLRSSKSTVLSQEEAMKHMEREQNRAHVHEKLLQVELEVRNKENATLKTQLNSTRVQLQDERNVGDQLREDSTRHFESSELLCKRDMALRSKLDSLERTMAEVDKSFVAQRESYTKKIEHLTAQYEAQNQSIAVLRQKLEITTKDYEYLVAQRQTAEVLRAKLFKENSQLVADRQKLGKDIESLVSQCGAAQEALKRSVSFGTTLAERRRSAEEALEVSVKEAEFLAVKLNAAESELLRYSVHYGLLPIDDEESNDVEETGPTELPIQSNDEFASAEHIEFADEGHEDENTKVSEEVYGLDWTSESEEENEDDCESESGEDSEEDYDFMDESSDSDDASMQGSER